ncbi:MAG: alpha-amylase family glycosyl hydrolase [Pseudomonadota bacterium]
MSATRTSAGADGMKRDAPWWRGAVIYQIYPRSFLDSNGDGVGDLPGIWHGLDYVASLGVDGVWLSPFFTSPMDDFGYDVADYRGVDPVFGTLADFDAIIDKAHRLGLKVIIDQVYSHTSDAHAWFQESRRDKTNPKADWYVWADPKPDGAPPNNWQSVFVGAAWDWDARRRQYYLHNFLRSQPDLNVHNPEVQDALLDVARFWLDRGVDGFRLDAINFAMHDPELRDNPPAPDDGRARTRPFDFQDHVRNMSHKGIPAFLSRLRDVTDQYDAIFTVAEIVGADPLAEMKAFTAGETHLNSAYNFSFLYADALTPGHARASVSAWSGAPGEGWPSWAFSNHDAPRCISRWASEDRRLTVSKLYLLLLMALRGNAFLYQGEELGLPQAIVPFESLQDPEAIANWPLTLGRDGARTPMPWRTDAPNAGFSNDAPWLPVDQRHAALAIDRQEADAQSTLHFTRKLTALRKASPALRVGEIEFIDAPGDVLAFYRRAGEERLLCVFNLGEAGVDWRPPVSGAFERIAQLGFDDDAAYPPPSMPAHSAYIATRAP